MSKWLTYSPTSGYGHGLITVSASTISELEERVANITATNSYYNLSATTTVIQGYTADYLTLEILTGGTIGFCLYYEGEATVDYSVNNGNWNTIHLVNPEQHPEDQKEYVFNVSAGDKVRFRGNQKNYWASKFCGNAYFNAYGNIMSLIFGDDFIGKELTTDTRLQGLFEASNIVSAKNLIIPGDTMPLACCEEMFAVCTALTEGPSLPATTLSNGCYEMMFRYCISLTESPILPAQTLSPHSYNRMFWACSGLKKITCLATDISASSCTQGWVEGVSRNGLNQNGTFVKNPNMSGWRTGNDGIPNGWTVIDA